MVEITEKKFRNWCIRKKYYCKKFATHTATGSGTKQPSDFLVANGNFIWFVETKECDNKENRFDFERFTQYEKLKNTCRIANVIQPRLIMNFPKVKKLVVMNLYEYEELVLNNTFKDGKPKKSITITQIPDKYKTTWKDLKL